MSGIGEKELEFQAGLYVVELLRAVLEERKPKEKPDMLSMENIYRMAKKHSVECMAYDGAVQIAEPGDEAVMQKWKERSRLCGIQGMVQKAESEKLFKELPAHGIRILPLKGCIMKKLYPKESYRQMADLDILIDEENAGKAREVMEGLGDEKSRGEETVIPYVKKPWINVELHHSLLPVWKENHGRYQKIWECADEKNGIFQMSWDDYYIYMIEHFAKHFYLSGSGIRSVMDIYVFLEKMKGQLHPDYLEEQFQVRKLEKFRRDMERIADKWFFKGGVGEVEKAEEIIIFSGVYGTEKGYYRNIEERIAEKSYSQGLSKIIYVFKRIFPGYAFMCGAYPILRKCPPLLPVMWIYRAAVAVCKRPEKLKRELNFINRKEKE